MGEREQEVLGEIAQAAPTHEDGHLEILSKVNHLMEKLFVSRRMLDCFERVLELCIDRIYVRIQQAEEEAKDAVARLEDRLLEATRSFAPLLEARQLVAQTVRRQKRRMSQPRTNTPARRHRMRFRTFIRAARSLG